MNIKSSIYRDKTTYEVNPKDIDRALATPYPINFLVSVVERVNGLPPIDTFYRCYNTDPETAEWKLTATTEDGREVFFLRDCLPCDEIAENRDELNTF